MGEASNRRVETLDDSPFTDARALLHSGESFPTEVGMRLIGLALALDVALLVVLSGCAQQAKPSTPSTTAQPESPTTQPTPPAIPEQTTTPTDSAGTSGAPQNLDEFT